MLQITKYLSRKPNILTPMVLQHSKTTTIGQTEILNATCSAPASTRDTDATGIKRGPICPPVLKQSGGSKKDGGGKTGLIRAKEPGKCRMGFIPEEWFLFFRPMTGVSGPYIFMIGSANYLASKEILVMEHEYYLGLSVFVVLYIVTTRLGPTIGLTLDKEVDAVANELESSRQAEVAAMNTHIKDAQTAIWRAQGQKDLIEAKKENVAIQLESVYRERQMVVYRSVRRRMEYHVKKHWVGRRIKHKWMVQWILKNVYKGITPEFKKHVMEIAIRDLTVLADKYEAGAKK